MSEFCTHVTPECPVVATLYGYRPDLAANTIFAVVFAILLVAQLSLGLWKRTWSYMIGVSIGCFGELLGYIGRLLMYRNPWSQPGLEIQICCLVLAPSFLAAGIYVTLKHVVLDKGAEYSRIRPQLFPWIFILCDGGSIAMQAIGGGIAAAAGSGGNLALSDIGDDLIIAGIAFQIFAMAIFLGLALEYMSRLKKAKKERTEESIFRQESEVGWHHGYAHQQLIFFCYSMAFAYIMILIRCIYRIHEMAGGWGNPRMRDETLFLVLDGAMIALATIAMTIAHPALAFPPMQRAPRQNGGQLVQEEVEKIDMNA